MKVNLAAGVVFRDDWEILKLAIANLSVLGVSRFFVLNHLSPTDQASELIAGLGKGLEVTILKKETTPFLQGRMMTMTASLAKSEGYDIFIPFDADEFHDAIDGLPSTFSSELETWFSNTELSHLHLPVRDYVQSSDVLAFEPSSLSSAIWRVSSTFGASEWGDHLRRGGSVLSHPERSKIIVKLSGKESMESLRIEEGSHAIESCGDACLDTRSWSLNLVVRHLPYYSAQVVARKRTHRAGRLAAGFSEEIGLQNNLLSEILDSDLKIWERNSQTQGVLPDNELTLVRDEGLIGVHRRLIEAGHLKERRTLNQISSTKIAKDRVSDDIIQKAFEWALDNSIGFPELEKLRLKTSELEVEATLQRYEAANARSTLDDLHRSRSWRWTSFFRSINRVVMRLRRRF